MSPRNEFPYEMFGSWLDQDAADRMLEGDVDADDAPPAFAGTARLLAALRTAPADDELADEWVAIAAAVRVLHDPALAPANPRRSKMRSKLTRAKIAGLVVIGTLAGTTGMAAANVLPDPAQHAVSTALSHIGVNVPDVAATATSIEHPAATGAEISQLATATDTTGLAKGAEISTAASGGMSRAGTQGGAGSDASGSAKAQTPNPGGTATGGQASGGADQTGAAIGDQASGGHADQGSANASATPSEPAPLPSP
jgi:hypothetical protein